MLAMIIPIPIPLLSNTLIWIVVALGFCLCLSGLSILLIKLKMNHKLRYNSYVRIKKCEDKVK